MAIVYYQWYISRIQLLFLRNFAKSQLKSFTWKKTRKSRTPTGFLGWSIFLKRLAAKLNLGSRSLTVSKTGRPLFSTARQPSCRTPCWIILRAPLTSQSVHQLPSPNCLRMPWWYLLIYWISLVLAGGWCSAIARSEQAVRVWRPIRGRTALGSNWAWIGSSILRSIPECWDFLSLFGAVLIEWQSWVN